MNETIETKLSEYESMMHQIKDFSEELHKKNQKRIKVGLWCILIIPMIFLVLLFAMDKSKVVFLSLWVISLFLIAAYLIVVAYIDYEMQQKLTNLGIKMQTEHETLIGPDKFQNWSK